MQTVMGKCRVLSKLLLWAKSDVAKSKFYQMKIQCVDKSLYADHYKGYKNYVKKLNRCTLLKLIVMFVSLHF